MAKYFDFIALGLLFIQCLSVVVLGSALHHFRKPGRLVEIVSYSVLVIGLVIVGAQIAFGEQYSFFFDTGIYIIMFTQAQLVTIVSRLRKTGS